MTAFDRSLPQTYSRGVMRSYSFNDLATLSGNSRNEAKHLVQTGTICPAIESD